MSQPIELTADVNIEEQSASLPKRLSVLLYGLMSYSIGNAGLIWLILALGGILPSGLSDYQSSSVGVALLINMGLIFLFAVQHTIMARPFFKSWLTRYIPEAAERSSFLLMSGVFSILAIYFWQPVPGIVWSVENSVAQIAMWVLYGLGWAYLLAATFVTNHFELMGLRQVYFYFKDKPYTSLPFTRKFMYRYSRHPMMLGFLIGMWAIPVMSASHFILSTLLTAYLMMGIYFEERDLIKKFGETYREYKKDIATFIPNIY